MKVESETCLIRAVRFYAKPRVIPTAIKRIIFIRVYYFADRGIQESRGRRKAQSSQYLDVRRRKAGGR